MSSSPITFERCLHDAANPYVIVSQSLMQDNSISPAAKYTLIYLLSLPPRWQVYHSNLCVALNIGKVALSGYLNELMNAGYVERSRERIGGVFQPYKYVVREFKKIFESTSAGFPQRVSRSGKPASTKEEEREKTKETTTGTLHSPPPAAAAAVSLDRERRDSPEERVSLPSAAPAPAPKLSSSEARPHTPRFQYDQSNRAQITQPIYVSLANLDIPQREKEWISCSYSEECVRKATEWLLSPQTKVRTTQVQALKFACSTGLSGEDVPSNKLTVMEIIQLNFRHYGEYNGATCFLDKKGLAFERGMKNEQVDFKYLTLDKVKAICSNFGIDLKLDF